jgi:hypothetical protein
MENTIKIEVTLNQLNTVLAGLAKLPLEISLETFNVVRQQADRQVQQAPQGPLSDKIIN